jgi:hypothetical protein
MKQVTRNIDPALAHDLLERVPRACIAFVDDNGPQAQPIQLRWNEPQYLIGIPQSASRLPSPGQEVVLLVDEGVQYFDLRAIYVRGLIQAVPPPATAARDHSWFALVPSKTVAWDYGTMREVDDEQQ